MNSMFYKLLDNTMAEVCRREPAYTSSFPITVSPGEMASAYCQHTLCSDLPRELVEQALTEGLAYIARRWTKAEKASTAADPIAHLLCDCIVDAFCADQGLLALEPHDGCNGSIFEVLARDYRERHTAGGLRYFVRNQGRHPLLLINATGTPIQIWEQFLADPSHSFKIILPRRRGSDLFNGGLQQHLDLRAESSDLSSIIDSELLEQVAVLAWCNGARVAIDLANHKPDQISSLVLLGPMLKGIRGLTPSPSTFERDLQPLLEAVTRQSSLAPYLSRTISKQPASPDWTRWAHAPIPRAQALFSLPAKDHAWGMMAPLSDAQSLINIARRVASDESYPMHNALGKLRARTMVIMGSDDNIVSNELVVAAIKKMCAISISMVVLKGSGHYIHDLQYHYFRWLLTEFLDRHKPPSRTARISVEQ